jgi:hypothetical protein
MAVDGSTPSDQKRVPHCFAFFAKEWETVARCTSGSPSASSRVPDRRGATADVLFQLHEKQHENRPDADRQGKLHQRGVPQRISSGQGIRGQQHGESREYSKNQSAFPIHGCSSSLSPLHLENGMDFPASDFSGFLIFVILRDVLAGRKSLFEVAINLAQFPEDQQQQNRDYEQQELDVHLVVSWW